MRWSPLLAAALVAFPGLLMIDPAGADDHMQVSMWETKKVLGDAAVAFGLSGQVPSPGCTVQVELAGRLPASGLANRVIQFGSGWIHDAPGGIARRHVEGVTEHRVIEGNLWTTRTQFPLPLDDLSFTVAATNLRPWPPNDGTWEDGSPLGEYSMRVQVSCHGPFTTQLEAARGIVFLSMSHHGSGVSLWTPDGSAALQVEEEQTFASPTVRLLAGTDGLEAGRLSLDGPVSGSWTLFPGSPRLIGTEGGAGTYRLNLQRAEVFDDRFWALLMGLHQVNKLDEVASLSP